MLNLNSLMIGSTNPHVLVEFYTKIFSKKPDMPEEAWAGWQVGSTFFMVGEHSEMKSKAKEPGRVMFNLETTEVEEEFERMTSAGALGVKVPYEMGGMTIATLADPDGNYFQLMSPWKTVDL